VVRVPGYRSRAPGFDSRRYQIFWEVVGLEWDPLSLVGIIEELLEWKSSGSGQENRINGWGDLLHWPCDAFYLQKLSLTSPTSGGRSVGIVLLRTKGHRVFRSSFLHPSPNLEDQVPVFMSLSDREAQLYPQALGFLFIAFCDLAGYGGGIRTYLRTGILCEYYYIFNFPVSLFS
jgi:hypothetical protein